MSTSFALCDRVVDFPNLFSVNNGQLVICCFSSEDGRERDELEREEDSLVGHL